MCPFCGWDQREQPQPHAEPASLSAEAVKPPQPAGRASSPSIVERFPLQRRLVGALAVGVLLVLVFVVGAFVHGHDSNSEGKTPTSTINEPQVVPPPQHHSEVELVPAGTELQRAAAGAHRAYRTVSDARRAIVSPFAGAIAGLPARQETRWIRTPR